MNKKVNKKVEYYVRPVADASIIYWWPHRYHKRISAPSWEKLKDTDNIGEILKTHKYTFDFYPDNDDFHEEVEFDVIIKKITKTTITEFV